MNEMKSLLRPYLISGAALVLAAFITTAPRSLSAQANDLGPLIGGPDLPLISSSQGYLGVELADVDSEKAQALKLKEVRGALITLIDHDAPAGQIGLRVNDVVLQLNGQNVESAEQLRRILKEIPPGRKVGIEISRDGNIQTLAVELADRKVLGHDVWNKIGNGGDDFAPPPSMGILSGSGDAPTGGGFHMPFFGSSLNVGALVEPLTSQMAEYLGVASGLMVKQVARKSEAAASGMKAFDVILKVGSEQITNLASWDRALRANQGKPVQVTILRDKKQQTITLQVDSKHNRGAVEFEDVFPSGDCPLMAELDQQSVQNAAAAAAEMRRQFSNMQVLSQQQAEQLRKRAEALQNSMKDFNVDPQQIEQLGRQMEELQKSFNLDQFKIDPKQMDEFRRQMEQFEHEMDREMQVLRPGDFV
jgi:serine protease Do